MVIGTWSEPNSPEHGFLLNGGTYTSFDAPNSIATIGIAINNSGAYIEEGTDDKVATTFYLVEGSNVTKLKFPGAKGVTVASGLNNTGQVALYFEDHGGVYDSTTGTYTQIDVPRAYSTRVLGIDDKQTLVGYYVPVRRAQREGFEAKGKP